MTYFGDVMLGHFGVDYDAAAMQLAARKMTRKQSAKNAALRRKGVPKKIARKIAKPRRR
jgi:hypothetical protein